MYTVWSGKTLLGETAFEFAGQVGGSRMGGVFRPSQAYESVREVFERYEAVQRRMRDLHGGVRRSSPEALRAALQDSGVGEAIMDSLAEIDALQLEVITPAGERLPSSRILITPWSTPLPDLTAEQRSSVQADFAELGMTLEGPNYIIVALPPETERRPADSHREGSQDGA